MAALHELLGPARPIEVVDVGANPIGGERRAARAGLRAAHHHRGQAVADRDFAHAGRLDDEQLRHLALIAHHCYGSYDLALRCVVELEARAAVPRERYAASAAAP